MLSTSYIEQAICYALTLLQAATPSSKKSLCLAPTQQCSLTGQREQFAAPAQHPAQTRDGLFLDPQL